MPKRILSLLLCLVLCLSAAGTCAAPAAAAEAPLIKNIIYMIPDGGAMAPFYFADAMKAWGGFSTSVFPYASPITTNGMYIKDYLVGAETTYSASDPVTDSAASGTALATGYKTVNGYIGIDPEFKPHANILEACQTLGKNTGIVVTYEWTNATPAAFSAHDISRGNMDIMSEQIVNQGIDVVLGGTHSAFSSKPWFTDEALNALGYDVIYDRDQLESVEPGDRIWGKLPDAYFDVNRDAVTPGLPELVRAAITALDDGNENGFFLMVEGSAVDGGGHMNNVVYNASEFLAFDEACKIAIEFARGRDDTMVIIAPDHDTGGLYYDYSDLFSIVLEAQYAINSDLAHWETGNHTARNGGIFLYVPEGVPYPQGIDPEKTGQVAEEFYNAYGNFSAPYPENPANVIDNTDIVKYIASLIGVDLDAMTEELFVDVTDLGDYDRDTEWFTFQDRDIRIKRNASTAFVEGELVDLQGQIALYIEGRFYVPASLLAEEEEPEIHECASAAFEDLNVELWYHADTDFVLDTGLMKGISETRFAPNANLTRAMLVTVLHRLEGQPEAMGQPFADVDPDAYYAQPVLWARENGIVYGVSDTAFDPNANLTREQIAAILYRYAQYKGIDTETTEIFLHFEDAGDIAGYALPAMNWACGAGLLRGRTETMLSPRGSATRVEIAAILHRFIEGNT